MKNHSFNIADCISSRAPKLKRFSFSIPHHTILCSLSISSLLKTYFFSYFPTFETHNPENSSHPATLNHTIETLTIGKGALPTKCQRNHLRWFLLTFPSQRPSPLKIRVYFQLQAQYHYKQQSVSAPDDKKAKRYQTCPCHETIREFRHAAQIYWFDEDPRTLLPHDSTSSNPW